MRSCPWKCRMPLLFVESISNRIGWIVWIENAPVIGKIRGNER